MVDQLTAPDPPSFFWGNAPPDSPLSYQALQTRRKIAEALASKRSPFPKNAGEGLTYLGESLGDIMAMRSLDAQERAYEAEGNRSATEAARTLYGASPGGSAASAPAYGASPGGPAASAPALPPDTQATDTAPSSAVNMAAGGTPLPPPRPIYDRTALNQQVQDNPNLIPQWAAMIKGEGGNPAVQAETPANRMVTQGVPLARALETVKTGGYYPPDTYQRGYQQSPEDVARIKRAYIDPVLRGASPSTEALRFPATGNASNEPGNPFASRRAAAGIYNRSAWDPGGSGEMYVQQDTPAMQARLAATKFPARDAIASAMTPPPTQVASLQPAGGTATDAGGGDGGGILPDQVPPNPPIQTEIPPAPQIAQAGPLPPPAPRAGLPPQQYPPTPLPQATPIGQPRAPLQTPPSAAEKDATIRAMGTMDPNRKALWQGVADKLREQREYTDRQNAEVFKNQLGQQSTDVAAEQAARRALEMKRQEGQLPRPTEEGPPVDPRLGTPQSPQRTGIPQAPPVPPGVTPQKWAELQAPQMSKDLQGYETALPQFDDAVKALQLARNHPGREYGVGAFSEIAKRTPGTQAYDFGKIMDQIAGKNFLAAYQILKGAGAVTEVEGTKAEAAQARLATAQTKEGFDAALNDLESQLRRDLEIAQRKVNQPVTAYRRAGDNESYAPDIGQRRGNLEYIGGNPALQASWRRLQ